MRKLFVVLLCLLLAGAGWGAMSGRERAENAVPFARLEWKERSPSLGGLADSLPQKTIAELAELSQASVKDAGKRIGAMRLSFAALEDTYLRILVAQRKLTSRRAMELWERLHGVDGFRTTLRKISGSNPAQHKGHMYELELAEAGRLAGFAPVAVGKKFDDGKKAARTDLDVWLRRGAANVYIEAKNYAAATTSELPHFRADMDSLVSLGDGVRVFAMKTRPKSDAALRLLNDAAGRRGVHLLIGDAESVIAQLRRLLEE